MLNDVSVGETPTGAIDEGLSIISEAILIAGKGYVE